MIEITVDNVIFRTSEKHPVMKFLKDLEKQGLVKIYTVLDINNDRVLNKINHDVYYELLDICFPGASSRDLSVDDHAELFLLADHVQSGRDFFLTACPNKYINFGKSKLLERRGIKVKVPDSKFAKEISKLVKEY